MIVLTHRNGQLGNRLAYLKVFLAFALEHRTRAINLTFDEYAKYFQGTCSDWGFSLPLASQHWHLPWVLGRGLRVLLVMLRPLLTRYGSCLGFHAAELADDGLFLLDEENCINLAQNSHLVFYEGWPIVQPALLTKHADAIRHCFSLTEPYAGVVRACLSTARKNCDLLIGIHIRQGDYLNWHGGRHYFSSEQYVVLMRQIVALHTGKAVSFFVCSNVDQDWTLFAEFSVAHGIKGTVEDMYVLAECDEIYGPQSSYSGWAAYYGKKPLYWIVNPETFELIRPEVI